MCKIKICHLYPDILNLYGDRGNIICLEKRLAWRGIESEVVPVSIGTPLDYEEYDIFFIGGGQDFEQGILLKDLASGKSDAIKEAVEADKVFLAICGGYQMLGQYYKTWDGKECEFIGALDLHTVGHKERMIGDFAFQCDDDDGGMVVVGFENHSGKTFLGEGVRPLGKILAGNGNNGQDKTEGARYRNVFASYSHGSLLPKNPALCDLILEKAIQNKYPDIQLEPLDDTLEMKANAFMQKRLLK